MSLTEVIKYFRKPNMEVDNEEDADFMVVTKLEDGKIVGKETYLSETLAAGLEGMSEAIAERGDLKQDLPLSQAFSDTGNNPHIDDSIEVMPTVDPNEEGLHNTGKDLSRTGPEGNVPYDNNNSVNYQGTGDVKINLPTPYYGPDAKKLYDISGVVPEYQEDIRIVISDPLGDEKFMPEIKIDIAGHFEAPGGEEPTINLEKNDLKNHPGRKDPGTHINTIKAGEKGIADLMPISDIWKDAKEFSFSESIIQDESTTSVDRGFVHPSSWVGEVKYSPSSQKMQIKMNGKSYTHCGVTDRDFDAFQGAPSKGAHWNRIFRNAMQCVQGLSEALNIYRHKQPDEFDWIEPEEIENMKNYSAERGKGRFILAVASGESVTDHRPEGVESLRRRWTADEMKQNIRTAKGKLIDINHMYSKIDPHSGVIYDANWNHKTQKGEVMIWETDEVILDAIRDNIIEAVSINTGKPRRIDTNCDDGECFIEPSGTILGEENGVALAYVVTGNEGLDYHGQHIPALPPGMKFTKIYLVE